MRQFDSISLSPPHPEEHADREIGLRLEG